MSDSFTLSLPKTSFAMRGNLAQQEPLWLEFWAKNNCYAKKRYLNQQTSACKKDFYQQTSSCAKELNDQNSSSCSIGVSQKFSQKTSSKKPFILQDGPPYANGPIHMGHALNKILKDVVQRHKLLEGEDVLFIPGWDCHGLPIENYVEKELLKEKKNPKDLTPKEFRQRCRETAAHWIKEQKKNFQRLGILAHWEKPYTTMDFSFEGGIVHRLFQLLKKGYLYQGFRPVLWSPSEQTALAEAEVEYQDVVSPSLYVRFPVVETPLKDLEGSSVVIWTTTPWSLPGNQAVAYGEDIDYGLYIIKGLKEKSLGLCGEKILIATPLAQEVFQETGIEDYDCITSFKGKDLQGTKVAHPLHKEGFPQSVPMIPSEFVTSSGGTGLVHTAPAHGMEDFIVGQRHGLPLINPLSAQGVFLQDIPLVGGYSMYKVFETLLKPSLEKHNMLLGQRDYNHSYPHSWRSKKPLFYFLAKQWFLALDGSLGLRQKALQALPRVKWHPQNAYRRMEATLQSRPDWCISRQRLWGVPLMFFVNDQGEILQDEKLFNDIVRRVQEEGCDFWFQEDPRSMIPASYNPEQWHPVQDIVDVWVESGLVSSLILQGDWWKNSFQDISLIDKDNEKNQEKELQQDQLSQDQLSKDQSSQNQLSQDLFHHDFSSGPLWPADLYIEGSDQHRAWFQSSLTLSMALHESPPYKEVLTHGFILDEKGQKMSKSLGNVIDPLDIVEKKGADILRLWVVYSDYQKDMLVGQHILSRVEDLYRRFRNTLRYVLGSLHGWVPSAPFEGPEGTLEKWILHRLYTLHHELKAFYKTYDFRSMIHTLHGFCNEDLSAFYFHSLKDTLYCDGPGEKNIQDIRRVLYEVFVFLTHWLAPFLPFTTEEAWQCFKKDNLQDNPKTYSQALGYDFVVDPWCLHLNTTPQVPSSWENSACHEEVQQWMTFKDTLCALSEKKREDIPDLLQGHCHVYLHDKTTFSIFQQPEAKKLAENIGALSEVTFHYTQEDVKNVGELFCSEGYFSLSLEKNKGEKCQRCWKVKEDVTPWITSGVTHILCSRCQQVEKNYIA